MTYEEAKMQIQAIPEKIWNQLSEPDSEAMEMAFSALKEQEAKTQHSVKNTNVPYKDTINRQDALDAIGKCTDIYVNNLPTMVDKTEIYKALNEVPSAEPERKKGEWIDICGNLRCSECDIEYPDLYPDYDETNFCPNCGADMRE